MRMKIKMINRIKIGLLLLGFTALTSCQYQEIANADYPAGLIYLPAALQGIYSIDNLPTATLADPTPGNTYRFTVNTAKNEFNVPLAVYRSGIDESKKLLVNIAVNTDTINTLIATDTLNMKNTELLPSGKYTLPSSVNVKKDSTLGYFNLLVDLDFLKANAQKKYALGITISSNDSKSNHLYNTVVVLIYTKILTPVPDFTFAIDDSTKAVTFSNASKYATSYTWDFGDNSTSTDKSPNHSYVLSGNYDVILSATGIAGDVIKKKETVSIKN